MTPAALRALLARVPQLPLFARPTALEPMARLSERLGGGPKLFVKRDDAIPLGFGGNKIRKLAFVAARAQADGADTLITAGGVQSNHARATASTAARLGMRAALVINGRPPDKPAANALLDSILGAEIVYVGSRDERMPGMQHVAERLKGEGRKPFVIPVGASTPLGALGFVQGVVELLDQMPAPDFIFHATSSAGTQAGLVAGCRLLGLPTRVMGISADESAAVIQSEVRGIIEGLPDVLDVKADELQRGTPIEIDDTFVGEGYGIPTPASREAIEITARTEGFFLDPTYTAKAMAGLIAYVRQQRLKEGETVVFWHTGGQVGLFA